MSESYRLQDSDNRDDSGAAFEFEVPTLAEMIPYVDGALRGDVHEGSHWHIDRAVEALRRERFDLAQQELRSVGVYITLEMSDE